jgi:hypothetical protein
MGSPANATTPETDDSPAAALSGNRSLATIGKINGLLFAASSVFHLR